MSNTEAALYGNLALIPQVTNGYLNVGGGAVMLANQERDIGEWYFFIVFNS